MGLTEDLHDLVENPPPQGFELDELIQRRRARRAPSRALVAVAGFAAVALVMVGGYALTTRPHPAGHAAQAGAAPTTTATTAAPTATPSPAPDDSVTEARLTAVLAHLPGALHVPANAKFTSVPAPYAGDSVIYDSRQYSVSWKYDGVSYSVFVAHQPEKPDPKVNACKSGSGGACVHDGDKNGGVTYRLIFPTKHGAKAFRLSADYTASGGTNVIVGAWAVNDRLVIPTTLMTDLVRAAHNPGFILKP